MKAKDTEQKKHLGVLGLKPFAYCFVVQAMAAAVEVIFLTTLVLISPGHMAAQTDKMANLNLQASLLAEHQITRLATPLSFMAKNMDIAAAQDSRPNALKRGTTEKRARYHRTPCAERRTEYLFF